MRFLGDVLKKKKISLNVFNDVWRKKLISERALFNGVACLVLIKLTSKAEFEHQLSKTHASENCCRRNRILSENCCRRNTFDLKLLSAEQSSDAWVLFCFKLSLWDKFSQKPFLFLICCVRVQLQFISIYVRSALCLSFNGDIFWIISFIASVKCKHWDSCQSLACGWYSPFTQMTMGVLCAT